MALKKRPRIIQQSKKAYPAYVRLGWGVLFFAWLIVMSGLFSSQLSAPGIFQAVQLHKQIDQRKSKLKSIEEDLQELEAQKSELESNVATQEQAIRETLGYVANDELVFEFSSTTLFPKKE